VSGGHRLRLVQSGILAVHAAAILAAGVAALSHGVVAAIGWLGAAPPALVAHASASGR